MNEGRPRERVRQRIGFLLRLAERSATTSTLIDALTSLSAARPGEAAAGIAYYALFSLFPLLLMLVSAAGYVLQSPEAQQRLLETALDVFPVSRPVLERNVQQVLARRGTIGSVGLLSLLWSGTGALGVLVNNISRAWPESKRRSYAAYRVAALGTGVLAAMLAVLVISATAREFAPELRTLVWGSGSIIETRLWPLLSDALPTLLVFLVLLSLYRWVPSPSVKWRAALWGSFVAALALRMATGAFLWFLGSGLVRYERVYGSLGAIVALLFWIYLSAQIVLFGAHLCAAIARSSAPAAAPPPTSISSEPG